MMAKRLRRSGALMESYGPLRQRNFALLWTAGLVSLAGSWALRVALPVAVLQLTGSVAATSAVVIASVAPYLLGPVAGVFVDRWCRRRVLIVTNLLHSLALLPLLAVDDGGTVWLVYVVAFVQATLTQFVQPAENALLPMVVEPDQLVAANALNAVNNNIARLLGPAMGGAIAAWSGLSAVAMVDAATFLTAAGLVALVSGRYAATPKEQQAGQPRHGVAAVVHEMVDGFGAIRASRAVFVLIAAFTMTNVGEGIMGALMPVYVQELLHGGAPELGWLMSAQAVGGIMGGAVGGWFGVRFAPVRLISVGLVLLGLIDLVLFTYPAVAPVLWPGLLCFVLAGVPAVLASSTAMALTQSELVDAVRGRVFAAAGTAWGLAQLLGAGLAAAFAEQLGTMTLLIVQGVGFVVAGAGIAVLLRGSALVTPRLREPGVVPAEEVVAAGGERT